jgi:hypothetical protein
VYLDKGISVTSQYLTRALGEASYEADLPPRCALLASVAGSQPVKCRPSSIVQASHRQTQRAPTEKVDSPRCNGYLLLHLASNLQQPPRRFISFVRLEGGASLGVDRNPTT